MLASCILVFYPLLFAQTINPDTVLLEELIITATKSPRQLTNVPGRADLITRKHIEQLPSQSADDLLRLIPGININRSSGLFTIRPSVTLRGLGGEEQARTMVLIDGIPLNTSDDGGVNWNRIQSFNIERIEVFKGPGSSLYGNNAMGGVINIIPRTAKKKFEGSAAVGYGSFNTLQSNVWVGGKYNHNFYYSASASLLQSEGYNITPDSHKTDPDYSAKRFLDEAGLSFNAGYEISPLLKLDAGFEYYSSQRGEGEKIQAPDGEYRQFDSQLIRFGLKGSKNKFSYTLKIYQQSEEYYRIDEREKKGVYSRFDVSSDRNDYGAFLNTQYALSGKQILSAGIEYRDGSVEAGDFYQTSDDVVLNGGSLGNLAIYLQDEVILMNEKLRIIAGLRWDKVSFYDGYFDASGASVDYLLDYNPEFSTNDWNAISPRIGIRYHISPNSGIYASYSKGFRAAVLDDLTRSGFNFIGPKIANPELGPEYLNNYEAGANLKYENLRIEPTVYLSKGIDFLDYIATGDTLFGTRPVFQMENITRVKIFGVELGGYYQALSSLEIMSSYTYCDARTEVFEEKPELEGKSLKYSPKHKFTSGLLWQNDVLNTGLNVIYKGKQYTSDDNLQSIDAYWSLNLRLSRSLLNEKILLSLNISDLLDNAHMETAEFLSPGRTIMLKIEGRF